VSDTKIPKGHYAWVSAHFDSAKVGQLLSEIGSQGCVRGMRIPLSQIDPDWDKGVWLGEDGRVLLRDGKKVDEPGPLSVDSNEVHS
jgi:hypothetical protein